MRKLVTSFAAMLAVASSNAFSVGLIYLSCDLPNEKGISHFDFTLDEPNSTVTFYVKEANATNTEKAVYGPETVTWSSNIGFSKLTRTISRVDLSFTQEFDLLGDGKIRTSTGTCQIKTPQKRKF